MIELHRDRRSRALLGSRTLRSPDGSYFMPERNQIEALVQAAVDAALEKGLSL